MTSSQRVIKIFAQALAYFIIASIIISAVSFVYFISPKKDAKNITRDLQIKNDITSLDIDLKKSTLTIKIGDKYKIEAPEYVKTTVLDQKLQIKEKKNVYKKSNIVLYIPDTLYDDIYINAGIGKIDITNLYTTNLTLKAGVGEISIDKLNVMNKFILDGGIGEVDIKNAYINSLDLDSGVGNIKLQAILKDTSYIDLGVGNVDLDLDNALEYSFSISKGIGSVSVFGENATGNFGSGDTLIKIDGGIGNISVY